MHNNGTGLKNTPRPATPVETFGACCSPWKMLCTTPICSTGDPGHPPQRGVTVPPHPHSQTLRHASFVPARTSRHSEPWRRAELGWLAIPGIGMQHQYGQSMGGYYASQRWVPSCSPAPLPPCPYPPLLRSGGLPRSQAVRAAMVRARRGAVVNRAAAASKTGCSSSSSSRRRRRSTRHRSTRRCSTGSTCRSSTAGRSMGSSTPTSTRCAPRCQRCVLRVGHTPAVCTPQHTGAKLAMARAAGALEGRRV